MEQIYQIHRNTHNEAAKTRRQTYPKWRKREQTPEKEFKKLQASNLQDEEFKPPFVWVLNKLRGRIDQLNENINKKIGT